MKPNDPLVLNERIPGCDKCGASARSVFYEMMEDDVTEHQCKPKKRLFFDGVLIGILFYGVSFMLIVSILLLIRYFRVLF